jgi:hypothetical protein
LPTSRYQDGAVAHGVVLADLGFALASNVYKQRR